MQIAAGLMWGKQNHEGKQPQKDDAHPGLRIGGGSSIPQTTKPLHTSLIHTTLFLTEHILQAFLLLWRNDPIRFQDENLPIKWLFYRENCCAHAVSVQDMSISANRAGGFGNGDTGLFGAGWTSLILFHYTTEQIVDVNYFSH